MRYFIVFFILMFTVGGCSWFGVKDNPVVGDQTGQTEENFVIVKDVFVDYRTRDTIFYGIDINAADPILLLGQLPSGSTLQKGLDITGKSFVNAVLSPDKKFMAFSVLGVTNSWEGLYNMETKEVKQLTFLKKGYEPGVIYWAPDSSVVVFEDLITSGTPRRFLTVVGITRENLVFSPEIPEKGTWDVYNPVWKDEYLMLSAREVSGTQETAWQMKNYDVKTLEKKP